MILLLEIINTIREYQEKCVFKMNLTIIAAISKNNVIGKYGEIPWYIPEDIKRFKDITFNHPVIMGRKTYESLSEKFKPLPGRKNIVLSNTLNEQSGIYLARNIEQAIGFTDNKDSFIIGGGEIYKKFLPFSNTLNEQSGIYLARNIEQAIGFTDNKDSFIIGGGEIYKKFLPFSNKLEITRVNQNVFGDILFPEINFSEWDLINREDRGFYSFLTYLRKNQQF